MKSAFNLTAYERFVCFIRLLRSSSHHHTHTSLKHISPGSQKVSRPLPLYLVSVSSDPTSLRQYGADDPLQDSLILPSQQQQQQRSRSLLSVCLSSQQHRNCLSAVRADEEMQPSDSWSDGGQTAEQGVCHICSLSLSLSGCAGSCWDVTPPPQLVKHSAIKLTAITTSTYVSEISCGF